MPNHGCIEIRAQPLQWASPAETRPKKAHQVRLNVKVLFIVFFDWNGIAHHELLPQGHTVNKEYYLEVMRRLLEVICQKRTELWKTQSRILLCCFCVSFCPKTKP